jgi:enoyl-CoA hydratase
MTTHDDVLLLEATDGVLTMTLNRPGARNALSPDLIAALGVALDRLERDDAIHVGVITGTDPAFCAGLDIKAFAAATAESDRHAARTTIHRLGDLPKPLIGAVNGPSITGGLEVALACDFLIGSPAAWFADTHVTVGAFPGGGLTARLGRVVGVRTAQAMSLAGMRLDAEAARRAGLLAEIVAADELMPRARELAGVIAGADPEFVRIVRRLHGDNADRSIRDAVEAETAALFRWRSSGHMGWSPNRPSDHPEPPPTTPH